MIKSGSGFSNFNAPPTPECVSLSTQRPSCTYVRAHGGGEDTHQLGQVSSQSHCPSHSPSSEASGMRATRHRFGFPARCGHGVHTTVLHHFGDGGCGRGWVLGGRPVLDQGSQMGGLLPHSLGPATAHSSQPDSISVPIEKERERETVLFLLLHSDCSKTLCIRQQGRMACHSGGWLMEDLVSCTRC